MNRVDLLGEKGQVVTLAGPIRFNPFTHAQSTRATKKTEFWHFRLRL